MCEQKEKKNLLYKAIISRCHHPINDRQYIISHLSLIVLIQIECYLQKYLIEGACKIGRNITQQFNSPSF